MGGSADNDIEQKKKRFDEQVGGGRRSYRKKAQNVRVRVHSCLSTPLPPHPSPKYFVFVPFSVCVFFPRGVFLVHQNEPSLQSIRAFFRDVGVAFLGGRRGFPLKRLTTITSWYIFCLAPRLPSFSRFLFFGSLKSPPLRSWLFERWKNAFLSTHLRAHRSVFVRPTSWVSKTA